MTQSHEDGCHNLIAESDRFGEPCDCGPNVRSLADFKRFLAMDGATVQITQNDWMDPQKTSHPIQGKPDYFEPKTVKTLQSNTVQFSNGGWLQFPKAKHARFNGDVITLCMQQDGTFSECLVCKLTFGGN